MQVLASQVHLYHESVEIQKNFVSLNKPVSWNEFTGLLDDINKKYSGMCKGICTIWPHLSLTYSEVGVPTTSYTVK